METNTYDPTFAKIKFTNNKTEKLKATAINKCKNWGYSDAKPFDKITKKCEEIRDSLNDKIECKYFIRFQCID